MSTLYSIAKSVMEDLASLGIAVNPSCRIARAADFFWSSDGSPRPGIAPNDPKLHDALEGMRDLQQYVFILRELRACISNTELAERFSRCLKDHALPERHGGHTPGRDVQTELFVAAVCCKAGLQPQLNEQPDVRCEFQAEDIGIAVKRPKSQANRDHIIRDAADQIHQACVPGYIALDTSLLFNQTNERIIAPMSYDEFATLHSGFFKRLIDTHRRELDMWTSGKHVRGILIHDNQMRHDAQDGWQQASLHFVVPLPIDSSRRNARRFATTMSFLDAYHQGCPEDNTSRD